MDPQSALAAFSNEDLATKLRGEILTLMDQYLGKERAPGDGGF